MCVYSSSTCTQVEACPGIGICGICEIAPECNPSGGSSAKSSHASHGCATQKSHALGVQKLFSLTQISFNVQHVQHVQLSNFFLNFSSCDVVRSGVKQIMEPCRAALKPTAGSAKPDRRYLVNHSKQIRSLLERRTWHLGGRTNPTNPHFHWREIRHGYVIQRP